MLLVMFVFVLEIIWMENKQSNKAVSRVSLRILFCALIQKNSVGILSPLTFKLHFPARFYSLRPSFTKKRGFEWMLWDIRGAGVGFKERAAWMLSTVVWLIQNESSVWNIGSYTDTSGWSGTCVNCSPHLPRLSIIIHKIHFSRQTWQYLLKYLQ